MPITLNRIVNVAGPGRDSAFSASEKLNDNAADIESAVADLETADSAAVAKSLFDAHTILAATSDNTPAAVTVAEQTLVGRIAGGNITALTASQIRTLLNVEDGAAADMSAAELLAALLTVDGSGSGLDADLLDGNSAAAFATAAQGTAADAAKVKTDFLTVTQAVDLDAMETRVNSLDAAVILRGTWDASAGTFPGSGTAQAGDSYIVSVGGTVDSVVFVAGDRIIAILDNASTATFAANWFKADYTDAVLSVNGATGAVSVATSAQGALADTSLQPGGALGTPSSGTATNLTGTASGLTAGNVTTNANLTGIVTSTGNATAIADDAIAVAKLTKGTALQQIRTNAGATATEWFTPSAAGDFKADGTVDMTGQFRTNVGTFDSDVANGATANAYTFDTQNTYSTAGANLQRWSNNGTAVFDFSYQGGIDHANSGASTAAHSQSLNLNWTATTTRTSSGQFSAVIGEQNTASGSRAVAVGAANTSSGTYAFTAGDSNTASGGATSAIGAQSLASGEYSHARGYGASAVNRCTWALGGGNHAAQGDAQTLTSVLRITTADATQTTMLAYTTNYVIPADTSWYFRAMVLGRSNEADSNDSAAYKLEGVLTRDESNNTVILGSVTKTVIAESAGATAWDATAEADDTGEALAIKVTGEAATAIRWTARLDVVVVGYA